MLFSSRRKLYLGDMDPETGVYHQVKLYINTDGTYRVQKLMTGIKGKPRDRRNLTIPEAIAKFGQAAPMFEDSAEPSAPEMPGAQ